MCSRVSSLRFVDRKPITEGKGRRIGIPFARGQHCPVHALRDWLSVAKITEGAMFRPVDRHGRIKNGRLSPQAVSSITKARIAALGHDPSQYSGHSLRAGLATSAALAGLPIWKIRQQTGHASEAMLQRYIREGELFRGERSGLSAVTLKDQGLMAASITRRTRSSSLGSKPPRVAITLSIMRDLSPVWALPCGQPKRTATGTSSLWVTFPIVSMEGEAVPRSIRPTMSKVRSIFAARSLCVHPRSFRNRRIWPPRRRRMRAALDPAIGKA